MQTDNMYVGVNLHSLDTKWSINLPYFRGIFLSLYQVTAK